MASSGSGFGTDMISIGIRTLDSRTCWVLTNKNILIGALKEEVSRTMRIPRERQRLLYRGRELRDENTLSSYNIQNDHMLHLVIRQPNAAASSTFVNGVTQFPFNIRFHGYGTMDYAREIISYFSAGLLINLPGNPNIAPEDTRQMASLYMEALRLMQSSSGRRTQIAMVPSEQPLVHILQSTTSMLNNLTRSVYMMCSMIRHQSGDTQLFEQRLVNNARILRTQLWNSTQFLYRLGCIMNDLTGPTMAEAAVNMPSQTGRTRSRRRRNNDQGENQNTRPSRRRRGNDT